MPESLDQAQKALISLVRSAAASGAPANQILTNLSTICNHNGFSDQTPSIIEHCEKIIAERQAPQRALSERIREWITDQSVTVGVTITVTACDNDLGIVTRRDKTNRRKIFSRLVAEGVIEPAGKQSGQFRVIDRSEEVIDWLHADAGSGLPIYWPLELEKRFEVMPGSVVVIAGESNSGKTAFVLDVARRNLGRWPTFYFSSSNETNARTLRKRLELFDDPLNIWEGMTALSRAGDFQDVLRPDALNLVDYLEVHADFYEIGGKLAAIAEKLKDGVAVVALQKNPGASFGRGGAMTLDKATAYLSLHRGDFEKQEPHILKFPKVKYPLVDFATKPIRFKLAGGSKFVRV